MSRFEIALLSGLFASTFLVQIRLPLLGVSCNNLAVPLFALALALPHRGSIRGALRAQRALLGAIGLLYVWLWVAAFDSILPAVSIRYAAKCLGYLIVLGALLLWLHGRPTARLAALRTVYALCVVLAALGIVEYWFPRFPFVGLRGELMIYPRIASLFIWPNQFAVVMAIAVALGTALRQVGTIQPLLFHAALVPLLIALALSGSRGGWLVLGALLLVLAIVRAIARPQAALILTAFALLLLSLPVMRARVGFVGADQPQRTGARGDAVSQMTAPAKTLAPRRQLWNAAFELIRQHPITGIGPEAFSHTAGVEVLGHPDLNTHNLIINIAAELGLVGLALSALCLWVLFRAGDPRDWMTSVPLLGLGLGQIFDCFTYDYAFMTFSLFFVAAHVSARRDVD